VNKFLVECIFNWFEANKKSLHTCTLVLHDWPHSHDPYTGTDWPHSHDPVHWLQIDLIPRPIHWYWL